MTDLIRNCAHHSTHQTLIDSGHGNGTARTIKTTFSVDGVAGIQAEYDGLSWYASRLRKDASAVVLAFRATAGYARLETPYVSGTVIPMPADPDSLSDKIGAAVEHYISQIWDGASTLSHGDYSLSNHVFDDADKVVRIIDWEHFNSDLPPQYDPLYMIVEPFLFWDVNGKEASEQSKSVARKSITKLRDEIDLPEQAIQSPASWLWKTADQHRDVWGKQASKVPFLNAAPESIAAIDNAIGDE